MAEHETLYEGQATIIRANGDGTFLVAAEAPLLCSGDDVICLMLSQNPVNRSPIARKFMSLPVIIAPHLMERLATEKEFMEWVSSRPCCSCGKEDYSHELGRTQNEISHVRMGSGAAIKPPFNFVPHCTSCHRVQHNAGYSAIGETLGGLQRKADRYKRQFIYDTIKRKLSLSSLTELTRQGIITIYGEDATEILKLIER